MTETTSVWIVDDDRSIRWVLEKALGSAGISASSFPDADSMMRKLRTQVPDAVISDIRMPGTDGLQLLALGAQRAGHLGGRGQNRVYAA